MTFDLIKKYIIKQICLKNILVKLNELEKLKHTTMSDEQLAFFEKIDNPQSNYLRKTRTNETIWDVRKEIDETFEQLYKKQKLKYRNDPQAENETISQNLIRLTEWIYDIKQ
jgi:hypothetical protein